MIASIYEDHNLKVNYPYFSILNGARANCKNDKPDVAFCFYLKSTVHCTL